MHFGDSTNELRFGRYAVNVGAFEANPVRFDMDAPGDSLRVEGDGDVRMSQNLYLDGTRMYGDNKEAIRYNDAWLRLNGANAFTS